MDSKHLENSNFNLTFVLQNVKSHESDLHSLRFQNVTYYIDKSHQLNILGKRADKRDDILRYQYHPKTDRLILIRTYDFLKRRFNETKITNFNCFEYIKKTKFDGNAYCVLGVGSLFLVVLFDHEIDEMKIIHSFSSRSKCVIKRIVRLDEEHLGLVNSDVEVFSLRELKVVNSWNANAYVTCVDQLKIERDRIAVCGDICNRENSFIRIFDWKTTELVKFFKRQHSGSVPTVRCFACKKKDYVVSASYSEKELFVWDCETGKIKKKLLPHSDRYINHIVCMFGTLISLSPQTTRFYSIGKSLGKENTSTEYKKSSNNRLCVVIPEKSLLLLCQQGRLSFIKVKGIPKYLFDSEEEGDLKERISYLEEDKEELDDLTFKIQTKSLQFTSFRSILLL